MLCLLLPYNNINQPSVYIYPLPFKPPFQSPITSLKVIIEHGAELPVLYSSFPLALYFTQSGLYMAVLLSQFIPPSPSPLTAQLVKNRPAMQETLVQFLGQKNPLEKG